jgi:peptidoglycan hydrolase CwlO-like protein
MIEEGRQLIQDFVTPEIRLIDVRLTALEKRVESFENKVEKRFDSLEASNDKRFTKLDGKIEKLQTTLEKKMGENHGQVMETLRRIETYNQILERQARVESKLQSVA